MEMSQYVADRERVNEEKIKQDEEILDQFGEYGYGWHDSDAAGEAAQKGIDESVVRAISADKGEPEWMLDYRLKGYQGVSRQAHARLGCGLVGVPCRELQVLREAA
jgi:Fe-S cluster assembly protein SufB